MAYTTEQITTILQKIIHPSTGNDIVSMNLVKDINVDGTSVKLKLSFPSVNDPLKNSLKKACERFRIAGISNRPFYRKN